MRWTLLVILALALMYVASANGQYPRTFSPSPGPISYSVKAQ